MGGVAESVDVDGDATPLVEVEPVRPDVARHQPHHRRAAAERPQLRRSRRRSCPARGRCPKGSRARTSRSSASAGPPSRSSSTAPRTTIRSTAAPALRYTQDSIREFEVDHDRLRGRVRPRAGRRRQHRHAIRARTGSTAARSGSVATTRWTRRTWRDRTRPSSAADQWGGTLGGPVKRDKAFFFGSFERLDETRGVNIDRSKIPAFVQSGIATPDGVEDFAIGPETGAYTLVGKVDVNVQRVTPPQRHRQRQRRGRHRAKSARRSPARRRCRARPATTGNERLGASSDARPTLFGQHHVPRIDASATPAPTPARTSSGPRVRSRCCCCCAVPASCRPARRSAARCMREPNRLQLGQTLSHFDDRWHGDHQFKAGWDFNHVTLTGFNEVTNDVEYSAAFLVPERQRHHRRLLPVRWGSRSRRRGSSRCRRSRAARSIST